MYNPIYFSIMAQNDPKYILAFVFPIICIVSAININIIPEYLNGRHFAHVEHCEIPCEFFENHENPDAEFDIAMNDKYVESAVSRHSKVPIRILGSQEPQHYYPLLKLEYLKHHFQGTAMLDRKSDIPWVLMFDMNIMRDVNISQNAQPKVTFVARNCGAMNNRNDYVKAIDAKIRVVSLGSCLNNAKWPDCNGTPCSKVEAIRPYKIHLAFENGDSPGFVTDKIYHAFAAGVLPVWMGTRDVAETVPKGSYIDVAEFNTPDDVANYLKLVLENETLYNSYFEWKYKPLDPEYVRNNRVLWTESAFCRVCYYVDTLQRGLEWDHQRQRAKSTAANSSTPKITICATMESARSTGIIPHSIHPGEQIRLTCQRYSSTISVVTISLIINSMLLFLAFRRKQLIRAFCPT